MVTKVGAGVSVTNELVTADLTWSLNKVTSRELVTAGGIDQLQDVTK